MCWVVEGIVAHDIYAAWWPALLLTYVGSGTDVPRHLFALLELA